MTWVHKACTAVLQDPVQKMLWIRDAALAVDPTDAVLAPHMRGILQPLYNSMQSVLSTLPANASTAQCNVALHVVNSILHTCP